MVSSRKQEKKQLWYHRLYLRPLKQGRRISSHITGHLYAASLLRIVQHAQPKLQADKVYSRSQFCRTIKQYITDEEQMSKYKTNSWGTWKTHEQSDTEEAKQSLQ